MLNSVRDKMTAWYARTSFRDGFAVTGPGHTKAAAACKETRNGRDTAAWYAIGRYLGLLDEDRAAQMLAAIESLQDTDPASPRFGCMRWYAEEEKIDDTNGAFFVQMPLVTLMTVAPELVPEADRAIILRILARGGRWFSHETEHGPIHYPNKILSDGGITLAIAHLTKDDALYAAGVRFFERWLRYTDEEGWGWGENMSIGYSAVIFSALKLAIRSLGEGEAGLAAGLRRKLDEQCEMFRFFDGHELTPAIRNYNYGGSEKVVSPVFNIAGVRGNGAERCGVLDSSVLLPLFEEEMYASDADYDARGLGNQQSVPRTRVTHVFHENEAYSWIGKNGSIGTLNNFPVYPNCYQHKTWGLGWQCMPVNAAVYGERVSYLRWVVEGDGWTRIHPKHCYLSPALFDGGEPYPAVRTRCRQAENAAIVFRTMEQIDHDARSITDEWYIPACTAQIRTIGAFTCIVYPKAAILLAPLAGGRIERQDDADGAVRLCTVRASSESGHITEAELASGWAACFWDSELEMGTLEEYAASLQLTEEYTLSPHFTDRVTLSRGGAGLLFWNYDIREPSTL